MSNFAVQVAEVKTGIVPVYNQATAADEFVNNGRIAIHVRNDHADEARSVTINSQKGCNQEEGDHDITVEITAAQDEKVIGPFPKARWNDLNGKVQLTYTGEVTNIKVAVIQIN